MSDIFGSILPWAEPSWYQGRPSPYYKESHRHLRHVLRQWLDENVAGHVEEWASQGQVPDDIYRKCARDGIIMPAAAGKSIPHEYGHLPIIAGIKAEDWDGFHDMILWDEIFREGALSSAFIGLCVGFPPLQNYANEALKRKIMPEILSGNKRICLAITEPAAGSDVRNITTTALLGEDGQNYIVNGEKKWITNGMFSDYFMTLVRTGGCGAEGLSMLLIPRSAGVTTRKVEIGAGGISATTYVTFEDVEVPKSYLVGKEGMGFRYTMSNFNHERLWITFQALRMSRTCLEDAMVWAQKREAFDKKLIEQPVVRWKFANCARQVESLQTWTEQVVYELDNLTKEDGNKRLGGVTALLKAHAGIVAKYTADECQKLLGGLGLTKTGQGARIEAIARGIPTIVVPGGSEDVMLDMSVRFALTRSNALPAESKHKL